MSCNGPNKACGRAAGLNGIGGYVNRSLGAIGSWGTINAAIRNAGGITLDPVKTLSQINPGDMSASMKRLSRTAALASANMALDAVGMSVTEDKKLRLNDARGLVLVAHALEKTSGAAVTMMARQYVRGKPYMKYQGVLVRKNPLPAGKTMNKLSRGRITPQQQDAYYFHQDGVTWASATTEVKVFKGSAPKTLSILKSYSFPNREFYFDRRLDERDAIDLVMGYKKPETLSGYLGHTTELDSLLRPLKRAKQSLMMLNWLTVDDTERDIPYETIVDYDRLFQKKKQLSRYSPYSYSWDRDGYALDYSQLRRGQRSASYRDLIRKSGKRPATKRAQSSAAPPSGKLSKTIKYQDLVKEVGAELSPATIKMPEYEEPLPLKIEAIDEYSDGAVYAEAYVRTPDGGWFPVVDQTVQKRLGRLVLNNFTKISWQQYADEDEK